MFNTACSTCQSQILPKDPSSMEDFYLLLPQQAVGRAEEAMQQNNGQSSMSNYKNSKKMKAGASDRDSNDNDMFPDQFSTPPNNAMITACSRTTLVNRLDRPQPQGSSSRVNVDDGNYIDPYFRGMEPGIRFFPLDQELVVEYLMKKIRNEPLPKNRIHEVNIYEYHPQTLAGSRNDASTSYNDSSQQPATHAASTSDTMEVYFNGIQPCYDYNMNRRCFGGNSNQIAAMMEPAMYTLPTNEDSAFRDDAMARIHEMWVSSNSRREG
ncbi:hypothetical protein D5086_029073 [Populus alba]|uniref:Uncharacterized protein n=1 Tax=Populus alba TaxID=43335 RepID=A0ACC4ASI5_POPAL